MNNAPITGYPENPEKKNRLEQIKTLIERHNFLVDQVTILEREFIEKDEILEDFKRIFNQDIQELKRLLEINNKLTTEVEKYKKYVSSSFKQVIKKPLYDKTKKRIENIGYENFIYRDELRRKLNE
jgi:hypothetical protein